MTIFRALEMLIMEKKFGLVPKSQKCGQKIKWQKGPPQSHGVLKLHFCET